MDAPTTVTDPQASPLHPIGDALRENLRFAVVLNGGVSLAIWMGGATHELHRLTRQSGGVYTRLLDWAMSDARVDVISGTSAGGINGAALALGQSNQLDTGDRLSLLRELWLDNGSFQNLLREPFQGAPTSLLQGDGFFLPQINEALRQLSRPFGAAGTDDHPIDLTITTTLLRGVPGVVVDSVGQRIGQVRHDGLFRFRRGPTHPSQGDDFGNVDEAAGQGDVVDALALAARSTASFPLAFEPSFIPASAEHGGTPTALHANVAHYLSGAWDQSQGGTKRARYGADGGALANTPTRPAMEAIDAMPVRGSGLVRRVMLLVHPHAPPIRTDRDDTAGEPPTLVQTGTSLIAATRSESGRNLVDLVERHNQLAGGRRDLRGDLVRLPSGLPAPEQLAGGAYLLYRRQRLRTMARELTGIWLEQRRQAAAAADRSVERFGSVLSTVQSAIEMESDADGSFLPPAGAEVSANVVASAVDPDDLPEPGQLGIDAAVGIADAAVDYLRRAVWYLATTGGPDDRLEGAPAEVVGAHEAAELARTAVSAARLEVSRLRGEILELRNHYLAGLRAAVANSSDADGELDAVQTWAQQALRSEAAISPQLTEHIADIAAAVLTARLPATVTTDDVTLAGFDGVLFDTGNPSATQVQERLTWLEILTALMGSSDSSGGSLPINLVQLTFQVAHPFAPSTMTGEDKVAGDLMARFSGFLKRSWRLNDWIWGRLDAAQVLCQTVLEPARVRRYLDVQLAAGVTPDVLARELLGFATATATDLTPAPPASMAGLTPEARAAAETAAAEQERTRLNTAAAALDLPTVEALRAELTELAMAPPNARLRPLVEVPKAFATALALEIAAEELPLLPGIVEQDLREGADRRAPGTVAVQAAKEVYLQAGSDEATPTERWRGLETFAKSGIGKESLSTEAGSDSLIHTATTAAANFVTMLDGSRSGLAPLKPLTRTLRGAALLPYWAVRGLTGGNTLARSLAQLTLGIGGVLVVLGLLGAAPTWATTAGTAAVLIAFAYGALRTGTILHSVVLLVPALVVLGFTLIEVTQDADAAVRQEQSSVVVVAAIALVAALFLLGSLRAPPEPPWTWARRSLVAASSWLVAVVLIGLLLWRLRVRAAWDVVVDRWRDVVPWLQEPWLGMPRGVVGLTALAILGLVLVASVAFRYRRPGAAPGTTTRLRSPRGLRDVSTSGWSWVYGVVAAGLAIALLYRPTAFADRVTIVVLSLLAAAALFLVVVPLRLLFRR